MQVKEGEEPEVYVAFSPRFEQIWLESKKRLPEYMERKPANAALRSQYSLRLYSWAKKYVEEGSQAIPLGSSDGCSAWSRSRIRREMSFAAAARWANFQQRALDVAILEINTKTDLKIKASSIERSKHRRVTGLTFTIKNQAIPKRRPDL